MHALDHSDSFRKASRAVRKRRTARGALEPAQPRHSPPRSAPKRKSTQRKQSPTPFRRSYKSRMKARSPRPTGRYWRSSSRSGGRVALRAEMTGFPLNNACQCGWFTLLLVFSFMPLSTAVSFDLTELRNKVAKIKVNPRGNLWATGERNLRPSRTGTFSGTECCCAHPTEHIPDFFFVQILLFFLNKCLF